MMRFALVILAALGAAHAGNEEVEKVFKDAINMIPRDDVIALFMDYAEHDAEVKAMAKEVKKSPSPETFMQIAEIITPYKALLSFYGKIGLDIAPYLNSAILFVHGMDNHVPNPPQVKPQRTGVGLGGFIQDFQKLLPMDKIAPMVLERKKTSPDIALFLKNVGSGNMEEILQEMWKTREMFQKVSGGHKKSVPRVDL